MAEIGEVYGQRYQDESQIQRMEYAVNIISNNIVHLNLKSKFQSRSMWNGHNLKPLAVQSLIKSVHERDSKMILQHIPKTSNMVNMFPYLIDGEVEYFRLLNLNVNKVYLLYLTPVCMEPY